MMISRLRLDDPGAVDVTKMMAGGEYWIHQEMSRMFAAPSDAGRSFVYRRDDRAGLPECIAVAQREPTEAGDAWTVETKPYAPRVEAGEVLSFMLRANPVVTRRVGPDQRHTRHDVVMDAKRRRREAGEAALPEAEICRLAGLEWIERKGGQHGFAVDADTLRVGGYRQHTIRKRKRSPIRLSTLDFDGVLRVTDPEQFRSVLYAGIGPAKGFGCGLLLVKRI